MTKSLNVFTAQVKYFLLLGRYTPEMSLGQRIIGARKAAGWEQAASFARDAGVSKQYLANLEKDKVDKPDPAQLKLIADALGVTLDWLWSGEGLPSKHQALTFQEWEQFNKLKSIPEEAISFALSYEALDLEGKQKISINMDEASAESLARKKAIARKNVKIIT